MKTLNRRKLDDAQRFFELLCEDNRNQAPYRPVPRASAGIPRQSTKDKADSAWNDFSRALAISKKKEAGGGL
jgi:hypothetical protein